MIDLEEIKKLTTGYRLYAEGMARAGMKLVAFDYQQAANNLEELQNLCDSKDQHIAYLERKIKELQKVSVHHNGSQWTQEDIHRMKMAGQNTQGYEQDGQVIAYAADSNVAKSLDHPHAPVNDGVVYGGIRSIEAGTALSTVRKARDIEVGIYDALMNFAKGRGVL